MIAIFLSEKGVRKYFVKTLTVFVLHIFTPTCYGTGAIMELLGFLLLVFEATFCCAKISAAQPLITRMEKLRFWHRAALYCG